jgi:hypothetical protein
MASYGRWGVSRPTKRELVAVANILDPSLSDEAMDMAREVVETLDDVRSSKDQWIVVARLMANGPDLAVGTWTTKRQALKASECLVSAHQEETPGTGMIVMPMRQPSWLEQFE